MRELEKTIEEDSLSSSDEIEKEIQIKKMVTLSDSD